MDLSSIKSNDRVVEILHPANMVEPIGLRVTIMSFADERLKKVRRAITDRKIASEQRGKTFKADEIDENANQMLIGAMIDWEWYTPEGSEQTTFHGEIPDFNRKNILAVFDELPWIRKQIDTACAEDQSFFGQSKSI